MTQVAPPEPSVRIVVIGAGQRGNAYASAVQGTSAAITAVADPVDFRRNDFGKKYIWRQETPAEGQAFADWKEFLQYEVDRRRRAATGQEVEPGPDAAFICTLDTQHADIIIGLAPLGLHILSEKPLATTLDDCLNIYAALLRDGPKSQPNAIFSTGHVLRYSPHNMLLRDLLLHQKVIGDVLSMEHTEPVGWWHFSHSYVRGNWRKESTTAPSLLTKSCHDIDLLLWILSSPADPSSAEPAHLPAVLTSTGHLAAFRRARKPKAAGNATNCLSCPHEQHCMYSAKKIYLETHLAKGNAGWPVSVVSPEIEECLNTAGSAAAEQKLTELLAEDYDAAVTPRTDVEGRNWFGRCVWEADNDVCDDQTVTLSWQDDALEEYPDSSRLAKSATFHMIAHTEAQCQRRGRISGTKGEITYDSTMIRWYSFENGGEQTLYPKQRGGGHGGGDAGLAEHFIDAVDAYKTGRMDLSTAQKTHIGCTLEDVIRSHAVVFAAEESRATRRFIDWLPWWRREVEAKLEERKGWTFVHGPG